MELFAINIRHIYIYIIISIDSLWLCTAYPLAGLAGSAPRQAYVHRDGDD